jgi:hypothetical protein
MSYDDWGVEDGGINMILTSSINGKKSKIER